METPKFEGNYLGIVVQNNDPLRQGRVKVFVPHISPTVYKNWTDTQDKDFSFKFIGKNINSDLSNIIDDLKKVLPWATQSMPIIGETASGRYNDTTKYATTSDSSNFNEQQANLARMQEIGSNQDGTGESSGAIFDQNAFSLNDAFNNPAETNANNVNKLSFNYKPETYSNKAKGSFAIPRVGAHVWVFFNGGDPLYPVIFGAAYGNDDWQGIYDVDLLNDLGQDYPGEYENSINNSNTPAKKTEYNINTETYRNKYVINQKGGTIQFVNTDNREMLKMTHFSGSFKEFNNQANIELAVNNDQKLVIGDLFQTIRGTRNEFTQQDYDCITQGDTYRKVGDVGRVLIHEQWKTAMSEIANIKQRFDIQRANPIGGMASSILKLNAKGQKRAGAPRLCPVCTAVDDGGRDISVNNFFPANPETFGISPLIDAHSGNKYGNLQNSSVPQNPAKQPLVYNDPKNTPLFAGTSRVNINRSGTVLLDVNNQPLPPTPGFLPSPLPGKVQCPVCNKNVFNKIVPDAAPGLSPSSYGGLWLPDPDKASLTQKYNDILPQLAKIETLLGKGGTEIIEIEKNKIETIGLVVNDWGAIRVDQVGKMEPGQVQVFPAFTRTIPVPTPLVEIVQVDDLPGGTYTLNVANRYSVLVGAGGINFKSYGVVNISGAITNIAGEQVNIGSALEVNVDGGKRLSLVGDVVTISQRNHQQVLVDSDLGVTGQAIVRGALYVEGPIFCHEINTVATAHQTNPVQQYGSGFTAHSPPTPMGTVITSDTSHIVEDKVDGVKIGEGTTPTYLGYTDKSRAVGVMPDGMYIGEVPATTITTGIPGVGGDIGSVNILTGQILSLNLPALAIIAKNNVTLPVPDPRVVQIPLPKSLTEIASSRTVPGDELDLIKALGGETDGAYIPGVGKGGTDENMPLRGLPKLQRDRIKDLFTLKDATMAPAVVYGDGSDWDAIKMAPSSQTIIGAANNLYTTNMDVRTEFSKRGNIPSPPAHLNNKSIIKDI